MEKIATWYQVFAPLPIYDIWAYLECRHLGTFCGSFLEQTLEEPSKFNKVE